MITVPADVEKSDASGGWDGVDDGNPNLESAMAWSEHQRIVCDARNLVVGQEFNFAVQQVNADGKKKFKRLRDAYSRVGGRSVLKVSKGIHQPLADPHLQLKLTTTYGGGQDQQIVVDTFHLRVSAVASAEMEGRFVWTPKQFSVEHNGAYVRWPEAAVISRKQGGLNRRNSVSAADLADHIQQVQEEAAAKLLADRLTAFAAQNGIDKSNLSKFKRGRGVPGTNGHYIYDRKSSGIIEVKRPGQDYVPAE